MHRAAGPAHQAPDPCPWGCLRLYCPREHNCTLGTELFMRSQAASRSPRCSPATQALHTWRWLCVAQPPDASSVNPGLAARAAGNSRPAAPSGVPRRTRRLCRPLRREEGQSPRGQDSRHLHGHLGPQDSERGRGPQSLLPSSRTAHRRSRGRDPGGLQGRSFSPPAGRTGPRCVKNRETQPQLELD
ncbi:hypothetical protein H920_11689 [Fukomys damarensis]|uniref:Uncharacterized protein n=1 Tax=Fukomys damarensis TaxID=885580 RepID=A0A091D490_FUKDA|nr:hypothetical protein H920_11689 [Fukomys damarensis]